MDLKKSPSNTKLQNKEGGRFCKTEYKLERTLHTLSEGLYKRPKQKSQEMRELWTSLQVNSGPEIIIERVSYP